MEDIALRIAVYKDTFAGGRGADKATLALAVALAERGHDAIALDRSRLDDVIGGNWDVVISSGTNELLDLAGRARAPVVQQFHTNPASQFKRKRLIRNWKIRRALRSVAAIQVLSKRFAGVVSSYGPPVYVVGNWSPQIHGDAAERPGAPCGAPRRKIIYPAAFSKGKNHALLLDAFALARKDFPDWTLELYGGGEPPRRLGQGVTAAGPRDLAQAYRECAFVAFPSLDEGLPMVLLEAAAAGKCAVTAFDWTGAAAAGGGIAAGRRARDFADAMRRLMGDQALCASMGAKARAFCASGYSKDAIVSKWEEILSRACARK